MNKCKPILISSFHNEGYLLKWWLEHHRKIFKHAVLFDYFSTDRSVEIIKKICPTWEIRKTRNKDWNFADNDKEFMEAEREFEDYKIVLTTTEFIVGDISELPKEKNVFAISMIRMVDNEPDKKPVYNKPLVEQKNVGFEDKSSNKYRFLHNYPDGQYTTGRHKTKYKVKRIPKICIYKYVFSPWTKEFIQRKLDMKKHMSKDDIKSGCGKHHTWEYKKLCEKYQEDLKKLVEGNADKGNSWVGS